MADDLRDRVGLVTGAASGLGRAVAEGLAEAGAEVVVADLDEEGGREVAERIGGHYVRCDVADLEENRAMVEFAVERCGGLDLVHLNAGVSTGCGVGDDFDLALYRRANGANLDGVVFGTHAALPALRARGGGSIVATASLAGLTAMPLDPIYTANKHAVVGFARAMGLALGADGIVYNAVCPGFAESAIIAGMRDELIAAGFQIIPAQDVAAAVLGLFRGPDTGQALVVQPGRDPLPYEFRRVPGPRGTAAAP